MEARHGCGSVPSAAADMSGGETVRSMEARSGSGSVPSGAACLFEPLPRLEMVVDLADHAGALADRRGDALERMRSHVADGKDTGNGSLVLLRRADQRPLVEQLLVG